MTSIGKWAAGLTALAVVAFAAGCGDDGKKDKDKPADKAAKKADGHDDHDHGAGPHGGAVADWAGGKYHVEFTVDHKAKTVKVYVLGSDVKKPVPIKADKVTLSIKKPPFQAELKPEPRKGDPEGAASVFVGTDDRFGVEQEFAGTISAEFGGKQYNGDFEEKADHDHKEKK